MARAAKVSASAEAGHVNSISWQWFVVSIYHPKISEFAITISHLRLAAVTSGLDD